MNAHAIFHGLPRDDDAPYTYPVFPCVCVCVSLLEQMHVIRLLQASVISSPCCVHNTSLLLCVRTCFNIYLGSDSPANQSAAKAALSRMINAIMSRMEGHSPAALDDKNVVRTKTSLLHFTYTHTRTHTHKKPRIPQCVIRSDNTYMHSWLLIFIYMHVYGQNQAARTRWVHLDAFRDGH
jgi:hypothetical protein